MSGSSGFGPLRLLRLIWRLYPPRWRRRYKRQIERDLRDASNETAGERRSSLALLWDAVATLPRAWMTEIGRIAPASATFTTLRGAWRTLARSPLYALFVVLTLSVALGVNAATFSVARSVLLESLPFPEPDRLVQIQPAPVDSEPEGGWSLQEELLDGPGLEGATVYLTGGGTNLVADDVATRLVLTQVDDRFFLLLGVTPALGRAVGAPDSGAPEAVISHALWRGAFGSDPAAIGRELDLSGHSVRIVGVAPPSMDFPGGTDAWVSLTTIFDFYPLAASPSVVGRLASREALPVVVERHRAVTERNWVGMPDYIPRPPVRVTYLRDQLVGSVRGPLLALLGAAGAVLLLGCANLAALQLSRLLRRSGELEVRRSLGATGSRVFAQLVVEMVLLAFAAGVIAVGVAVLAARVLIALLPAGLPGLGEVGISPPVLAFAAGGAALAALLAGTLPAWRAARRLGTGGRTHSPGPARGRIQSGLMATQVALALVMVIAAGLLGQSLTRFAAIPLGYDAGSVLTFTAHLPSGSYPDAATQGAWAESTLQALSDLPGVASAGFGSRLPFYRGTGVGLGLRAEGAGSDSEAVSLAWLRVSPDYFEALGIRFLAGGPPTPPASEDDTLGGVVLTRTTALRLFGEVSLDHRVVVSGGNGVPAPVVGVVEDLRLRGRANEPGPVAFGSAEGAIMRSPAFALRVEEDASSVVAGVRRVLSDIDPGVPPADVRTTRDAAELELATPRAVAILTSLFGVAGLGLVALGLYGSLAQWLATRRRELGVRLALGASAGRILLGTVGGALKLVLLGVLLGMPVALASTRLLGAFLYDVRPWNPAVFGGAVAVVLVVGASAALVPALRASRTAPVDSLRVE